MAASQVVREMLTVLTSSSATLACLADTLSGMAQLLQVQLSMVPDADQDPDHASPVIAEQVHNLPELVL